MADLMKSKYRIRGARDDDGTCTLEWENSEGQKRTKPATPAEEFLVRQCDSLISALHHALRRNAEYEKQAGK